MMKLFVYKVMRKPTDLCVCVMAVSDTVQEILGTCCLVYVFSHTDTTSSTIRSYPTICIRGHSYASWHLQHKTHLWGFYSVSFLWSNLYLSMQNADFKITVKFKTCTLQMMITFGTKILTIFNIIHNITSTITSTMRGKGCWGLHWS